MKNIKRKIIFFSNVTLIGLMLIIFVHIFSDYFFRLERATEDIVLSTLSVIVISSMLYVGVLSWIYFIKMKRQTLAKEEIESHWHNKSLVYILIIFFTLLAIFNMILRNFYSLLFFLPLIMSAIRYKKEKAREEDKK